MTEIAHPGFPSRVSLDAGVLSALQETVSQCLQLRACQIESGP